MTQIRYSFPLTGGLDRSVASIRSDPARFYQLLNLRQSRNEQGRLEQVPPFVLSKQAIQGTYYNGAASATEPTSSAVRGALPVGGSTNRIIVTDYCTWLEGTQLQQYTNFTAVPTSRGLNGACYVQINNVAGLGVTLGASLDIEIDAAATFRWRKNGGGWTAGVAITTTGVSIDGGNATVWFLVASGFTVADAWNIQRFDAHGTAPTSGTFYIPRQTKFALYGSDTYFIAPNSRLFKVTNAADTAYAITVGYRPLFGIDLAFFANHLVVAGANEGSSSAADIRDWGTGVGWSDRANFDNFEATDTNEADQYAFPELSNSGYPGVLGIFIKNETLFTITTTGIWFTPYLGLPTVFNFQKLSGRDSLPIDYSNTPTQHVVVKADDCVFLCGYRSIVRFDGNGFEEIGRPIAYQLVATVPVSGGVWLPQHEELCLLLTNSLLILCYQARTGTWYTRNASFAQTPGALFTDWYGDKLLIGLSTRNLYIEDSDFAGASPIKDAAVGGQYTEPTLRTHYIGGDRLSEMKESSGTFIGCVFRTPSGSYQDSYLQLGWCLADTGAQPTNATTDGVATLLNTSTNLFVSFPRVAGRALAFELKLKSTLGNTTAPGVVDIYAFEPLIYNLEQRKIER